MDNLLLSADATVELDRDEAMLELRRSDNMIYLWFRDPQNCFGTFVRVVCAEEQRVKLIYK